MSKTIQIRTKTTQAKRIGVSRQWVIEIEHGHPRAELALVLRAIDTLNIRIDASVDQDRRHSNAIDIDAIVAKAKKGKP